LTRRARTALGTATQCTRGNDSPSEGFWASRWTLRLASLRDFCRARSIIPKIPPRPAEVDATGATEISDSVPTSSPTYCSSRTSCVVVSGIDHIFPGKHENVGQSQPVLRMSNRIIDHIFPGTYENVGQSQPVLRMSNRIIDHIFPGTYENVGQSQPVLLMRNRITGMPAPAPG
jgi:hypothetical protein